MAIYILRIDGSIGDTINADPSHDFINEVISVNNYESFGFYQDRQGWDVQFVRNWGITHAEYKDGNGIGPLLAVGSPYSSNEYFASSGDVWKEVNFDVSVEAVFGFNEYEEGIEYARDLGFTQGAAQSDFEISHSYFQQPSELVVKNVGELDDFGIFTYGYVQLGYEWLITTEDVDPTDPPLFTSSADSRDLGFLSLDDFTVTDATRALGGSDSVTLPGSFGKWADWGVSPDGDGTIRFEAGTGNDVIQGRGLDDVILGGNDRDTLRGGSGNDELNGGYGDDFLDGEDGDDTLLPSSGNDTIKGGQGDDTFDFREGTFAAGAVLTLEGGKDQEGDVDTLRLEGPARDYQFKVYLGATWDATTTTVTYTRDGNSEEYRFKTDTILKADFTKAPTNNVSLRGDNLILETVRLSGEIYNETTATSVARHKWHAVAAMELGIKPSNYGKTDVWTFKYGVYERKTTESWFHNALIDIEIANDAVASAVTGVIGGEKTLTVTFKGSDDPRADIADWGYDLSRLLGAEGETKAYFGKYAAFVGGLKDYIEDKANGIEKVVVNGHSLGGGMTQHFVDNLVKSGVIAADRISGFTYNSIGAPSSTRDNANGHMMNFVRAYDATNLLNINDDGRAGPTVFINSARAPMWNNPIDTHSMDSIGDDVRFLIDRSDEGAFARSSLAKALAAGSLWASEENLRLTLGTGGADKVILPNSRDRFVLTGDGDDTIYLGETRAPGDGRKIDGGKGFDEVLIERAFADCVISKASDGGLRIFSDGREIGTMYNTQVHYFISTFGVTAIGADGGQIRSGSMVRISDDGARARAIEDFSSYRLDRDAVWTDAEGGDERIVGSSEADVLRLGNGRKVVEMGDGDDTVITRATSTDDVDLDGGEGGDLMVGGAGDDVFHVDDAGDQIVDHGGDDLVITSLDFMLPDDFENIRLTGDEKIAAIGNDHGNEITGNARGNHLAGKGGRDRINGGEGDDRLTGGMGRDTLTGGDDEDTFVFTSIEESKAGKSYRDVILDFERGQDKIDLSAIDASSASSKNNTFEFIGWHGYSDHARELRVSKGIISGDVDGDGKSDFQIALGERMTLSAEDFVL